MKALCRIPQKKEGGGREHSPRRCKKSLFHGGSISRYLHFHLQWSNPMVFLPPTVLVLSVLLRYHTTSTSAGLSKIGQWGQRDIEGRWGERSLFRGRGVERALSDNGLPRYYCTVYAERDMPFFVGRHKTFRIVLDIMSSEGTIGQMFLQSYCY